MTTPAGRHVKDMATTWHDFVRLLPVALDGWPYRVEGSSVEVGSPERGVTITVGALPPRRLGLMEVVRSRVALTFRGMTSGEQDSFLRQFDRAFQRGGG